MARKGFVYRGNLRGQESAVLHVIIANSETITVGDVVKASSGYVAAADANDTPVLGVVVGLVNKKGIDLRNAPTNTYDGTFTEATSTAWDTYTAAADNATDKQVKAIVNVDPYALYKNDADADLSASDAFQFFSLVDEDQIDGDTNSATVGELQLIEMDPDQESDDSQGLFRIASSALYAYEPET